MFQRAPPEVNGFGVTTSTPPAAGRPRSGCPSGCPCGRTNTTTEFWTIRRCTGLLPVLGDDARRRPARCMSGSSGRWTKSAGWPASTARDWSPEAPNEFENSTPSPSGGLLEARARATPRRPSAASSRRPGRSTRLPAATRLGVAVAAVVARFRRRLRCRRRGQGRECPWPGACDRGAARPPDQRSRPRRCGAWKVLS